MTYRQIKWLILMLPTVAIGLWEYARHTFLMDYISMETGNLLSPLIVFGVTIIFLLKLFGSLEKIQRELHEEKAERSALQERAKISRELHDGIAQSLFLLAIKTDKLGKELHIEHHPRFQKMQQTLQHIHEDTRQAITNLRVPPAEEKLQWRQMLENYVATLQEEHGLVLDLDWELDEPSLSAKEKIELFACIKEALMNAVKHGSANEVRLRGRKLPPNGFVISIENDTTMTEWPQSERRYGLQILQDRAKAMNATFAKELHNGIVTVTIRKEGSV
ncbi:two-component sensor histidine kinase [Fictibacillus macauensis ZFHKF-1]|uniref:histidine kinase n=1 Tax=Fictibacillus macauensis ZFHKF-1 TaxID=1196324 RepID=I8UEM1_9BACL|nr:histidine kinase [Fictibacillus macauensis]EIT85268.1 two-component sensor histidine kinase [Fictibacillus macauensis ZFHKF-1]